MSNKKSFEKHYNYGFHSTHFYLVQKTKGGPRGPRGAKGDLGLSNFWDNENKCIFNKYNIKDFVSCFWRVLGTTAPGGQHLTVPLYLCSSVSNEASLGSRWRRELLGGTEEKSLFLDLSSRQIDDLFAYSTPPNILLLASLPCSLLFCKENIPSPASDQGYFDWWTLLIQIRYFKRQYISNKAPKPDSCFMNRECCSHLFLFFAQIEMLSYFITCHKI